MVHTDFFDRRTEGHVFWGHTECTECTEFFLTEEQKDIFLHADGADGHGDLLAHRIHGMTQNFVFDRRT